MNELLIIIVLILLNGVFAMTEIAVISSRKSKLQADAAKGSKSAKKALQLADNPDRFLSSIQVGITLIGLLTGLFSGNKIATIFTDTLVAAGMRQGLAAGIAQTIIIIIVTYFTIVIGELVPKRIGMNSAEKVAKLLAAPMSFVASLAKPIVWILSKSTSGILKFLGIKEQESKVTEEEIINIIQEGADDGEVLPVEQDIVERVFTLGDLSVSSIMTLRSDIVWLDKDMTENQVRECIEKNMYEEYPVADGDLDHVIGILRLKEFVVNLGKQKHFSLSNMLTKPTYFHENMDVYKVLEEMKTKKVTRALICDEFGSCSGIITHKDILEALIGSVNNSEDIPDIVERAGGDSWLVEGNCSIYDFLSHFEMADEMQDYEYTTVAGLILDELEHVPEVGEFIEWGEFSFEVVDMDGPRIDKVIVKKISKKEDTISD